MNNRQINFIPRLLKVSSSVDEFQYFDGHAESYVYEMPLEKILQVVDKLKEMNEISKSVLNNKVYVHGDLSSSNVIFKENKLVGIIDWDSVSIGDEWEDFIYVAWTWLNIGSYARQNDKIFEYLLKMIDKYSPSTEFKSNFSDKIKKVMDNRLKKTSKNSANYERIFQWVGWSKIWVELYDDKIKKEIE